MAAPDSAGVTARRSPRLVGCPLHPSTVKHGFDPLTPVLEGSKARASSARVDGGSQGGGSGVGERPRSALDCDCSLDLGR